ncbi:MAG: hypothetical protein COW55_15830 [Rhodobacteraceae bacterium CG17_big_fil_post_rev_8_21_14_2_50_65_11]|nr:MAG: hypothetical protein COW55_15830 [Rhodobacteraceae bacterium CG17_big_fil_post_rev_8_21_14_2_50_65_11]
MHESLTLALRRMPESGRASGHSRKSLIRLSCQAKPLIWVSFYPKFGYRQETMMIGELSLRLRDLRDRNRWTVADMSERTGIPKRSLDKYMLRSGASLPGFDALCALSKGLGVSLDWLVFGADIAGEIVELIADRAANDMVQLFAETLLRYNSEGRSGIIGENEILTASPEEWAADLGLRAGERARELMASGTTKADLLTWKQWRTERMSELLSDRLSAMIPRSNPVGNGN